MSLIELYLTGFHPDPILQRLTGALIDFLASQTAKVVSSQIADTCLEARNNLDEFSHGQVRQPKFAFRTQNRHKSVVTIVIPEDNACRKEETVHTYKCASRAAKRGHYQATDEILQEATKGSPLPAVLHRGLDMAYYGSDNHKETRCHIVRALCLQPADAGSWIVLEQSSTQDSDRAESYCRRVYELVPLSQAESGPS